MFEYYVKKTHGVVSDKESNHLITYLLILVSC